MIAIFEGWISGKDVIAKGPFTVETFYYKIGRRKPHYRARLATGPKNTLCFSNGQPITSKTEGNTQAIVNTLFKKKLVDWHDPAPTVRPEDGPHAA